MDRLSCFALLLYIGLSSGQDGDELQSYATYQLKSRRLPATGSDSIVRNEGFGIHFFDIFVGNPAQKRTLAVTTNSDHTAFACQDCIKCGRLRSNVFNSSSSSAFSVVPCNQCSPKANCDGDRCIQRAQMKDLSSWSGYEVRDHVFHGDGVKLEAIIGTDAAVISGFPLQFICQTQARGYFESSVMNGVLGMSPAPTSFINQMYNAGKVKKPRFTLCFNNRNLNGMDDSNTGVVTFGGFERAFLQTEMVYTKKLLDVNEEHSYRINITKLHLRVGGGTSIRPDLEQATIPIAPMHGVNTEAVLDSSVPFMSFDRRWEPVFMQAWLQATGKAFSYGREELTYSQLESLPTLLIEIEGDPNTPKELDTSSVPNLTDDYNVLIAVPATRYMARLLTGKRGYRPRIKFDGIEGSTLGAIVMQGHSISYEIDMNRIGFAESQRCEASHAVSRGRSIENGSGGSNTTNVGGTLSINNAVPPSTAEPVSTLQVPSVNNDDMFVGTTSITSYAGIAPNSGETTSTLGKYTGGGCATASCRCFMAIGYVFIGTALAVAYRLSRPKERTLASFENFERDEEPLVFSVDASAYRRKTFHEGGTMV